MWDVAREGLSHSRISLDLGTYLQLGCGVADVQCVEALGVNA